MKNIRLNVFETNSSSSHSISISQDTDGLLDSLYVDENGTVHLQGGDFGWEVESYSDAGTKANYCFSDLVYQDYRDNDKLKIKNQDLFDMLIKVIKNHTGATQVTYEQTGYGIDHQSQGTSYDAFESEDTLKRFLFDPNSVLYTDNDNH